MVCDGEYYGVLRWCEEYQWFGGLFEYTLGFVVECTDYVCVAGCTDGVYKCDYVFIVMVGKVGMGMDEWNVSVDSVYQERKCALIRRNGNVVGRVTVDLCCVDIEEMYCIVDGERVKISIDGDRIEIEPCKIDQRG